MNRSFKLIVAATGIAAFSTAAHAENSASGSFRISVQVPEYCEINASPIFVSQGDGFAHGTVFESCNIQEGFQVVASHRPLEAQERVALSYAGHASFLRPEGWTQVANRVGAKYGMRPVSIRHSGLAQPLAINLTITYF